MYIYIYIYIYIYKEKERERETERDVCRNKFIVGINSKLELNQISRAIGIFDYPIRAGLKCPPFHLNSKKEIVLCIQGVPNLNPKVSRAYIN